LRSVVRKLFRGKPDATPSLGGIEELLRAAGPGARGIVLGISPRGVTHAFNAYNDNGVVRFVDGQIGGPPSLKGYAQFMWMWTHQP
jgi:hypothetical protein